MFRSKMWLAANKAVQVLGSGCPLACEEGNGSMTNISIPNTPVTVTWKGSQAVYLAGPIAGNVTVTRLVDVVQTSGTPLPRKLPPRRIVARDKPTRFNARHGTAAGIQSISHTVVLRLRTFSQSTLDMS